MDKLEYLKSSNFSERIVQLDNIETNQIQQALPECISLCSFDPQDNDPFQHMLRIVLKKLLSNNEEQTLIGLQNKNPVIQTICIQVSGEMKFASTINELLRLCALESSNFNIIFEALSALSKFDNPKVLEIFSNLILNKDPLISSLAIDVIGKFKDTKSVPALCNIVYSAEDDEHFLQCELNTYRAILALGQIQNQDTISFLASKIHHRNPTARRIIYEELLKSGEAAVPFLEPIFEQDNTDKKILTANILGDIGGKKAGSVLVNAIDNGKVDHPNIKFAIYESLGKITFLKGIICLMDGLEETNELILIAVIDALNAQMSPSIIKKIKEMINIGNAQSQKIIKTIVKAKAVKIFSELYNDDNIGAQLISQIIQSRDNDIVNSFIERIIGKNTPRSQNDYQKLESIVDSKLEKCILAVDDSKAMILFYRSVVSNMGFNIITAVNGKEALSLLEYSEPVRFNSYRYEYAGYGWNRILQKSSGKPFMARYPIAYGNNRVRKISARNCKKSWR
ncbi:MAG: response regulator [Desulfobacterales bacterium]|nr:response regulator [Desulfobacterales bacterium]